MPTIDAEATLVDPTSVPDGLTTTVARDDVEEALRLDEPPASCSTSRAATSSAT